MLKEPTIKDIKLCSDSLSEACERDERTEVSRLLGEMNFIRTRLMVSGVISFDIMLKEELRLVGTGEGEPNAKLSGLGREEER